MTVSRISGVPGVGDVGWGSHFCHFYDSRDDLADTLVPYFQSGLENNEACLWVTSEPFSSADAWDALEAVVPDLSRRERAGQIEIIDHGEWYRRVARHGARDTLQAWVDREAAALQRGFSGLRLTGNTYWLDRADWDSFMEYESLVNQAFRRYRIVGLCSYCLSQCTPYDVLDVVRTHEFAVTRRSGTWEVLEGATLKLARQDLRRLQESEQKLRDADRRKDEFLAMLGHELRNPLTPIRSGIDLLSLEDGPHQDVIQLMQQQVEHLVRLVDDLLDISRILRGNVELRREHVDVRTIVGRSLQSVRHALDQQEQIVHAALPEEPLYLNADPVRMAQVLENLLINASKYSMHGGRIEIAVERDEESAIIRVSDNGVGMDSDLLPEVFDLFTQSARSLDRSQGGLGVGLTLVRRMVELHGGSVSAWSEGEGKGSLFTVRIPISQGKRLRD